MATLIDDLKRIAEELDVLADESQEKAVQSPLKKVEDAVIQAHKAFSGSWIGYHSRVYYDGLEPTPPDAHFSPIWGLSERFSGDTVTVEFKRDAVQLIESQGLSMAEASRRLGVPEALLRRWRKELGITKTAGVPVADQSTALESPTRPSRGLPTSTPPAATATSRGC